jgi:hypothetical protein
MTVRSRPVRPLMALVACLAGPVIWSGHFMALYGMQAVICSRLPDGDNVAAIQIAGGALSGLAILALVIAGRSPPAREPGFLGAATRALLWLAAPAVIWASTMLLAIPACGG